MKKLLFPLLMGIIISCASSKKSSSFLKEDEFFITRKYVGNFIDYSYTDPRTVGGPPLIWIKTTQDSTYSKISAYSRKCEFSVGDRLYLRRIYTPSGVFGSWIYQIENDFSIYYRISEFQFEDKILVQTWF